jgi:NAD(P)-dependent dehydrogenase (short-subunit alcohol dehydrogenase family)
MQDDLDGREVVVTGAGGALGGAVARLLLRCGAVCHLPVRDEGVPDEIANSDRARVTRGVDLTDEDAVTRYFRGPRRLWGSVHCVGGFAMAPIAETSLGDFTRMQSLNASTAFLCCRESARRMRETGDGGRIVNVAARPALEPRTGRGMVAYTASKGAVAALTEALAEELAADGIWVNAVAPSILDTPANRKAMPRADSSAWPSVDDVAAVIAFLVSPRNRSGRGGVLPVYGKA